MIDFADDVVIVGTTRTKYDPDCKLNVVMEVIGKLLKGVTMATPKTADIQVIGRKKRLERLEVEMNYQNVRVKFKQHLQYCTENAAQTQRPYPTSSGTQVVRTPQLEKF